MLRRLSALLLALTLISIPNFTASATVYPDDNPTYARQYAAEGIVLLENDGVLPLKPTDTVDLFGRGHRNHSGTAVNNYQNWVNSGGGAAFVFSSYTRDLDYGMNEKNTAGKVKVNQTLRTWYGGRTAAQLNDLTNEAGITQAIIESNTSPSDIAIVTFARNSKENRDRFVEPTDLNATDAGSYKLNAGELQLMGWLNARFSRIVVVMHISGVTDLSWIKDYNNISAVVVAFQGGMEGGTALADVLCGDVNPSGKLADTFAYSWNDYPSSANYGTLNNRYQEDVYVGYRYFVTADPNYEKVQYEFGYGKSYSDFTVSEKAVTVVGDEIVASAKVTNNGPYPGKEVLQTYYSAPAGALNKPAFELAAFAKTKLLAVGESQMLEMRFAIDDMASYDDLGKTGNKSAYVLEAGNYGVYIGNSVKNATKTNGVVGTYTQPALKVVKQLTSLAGPLSTNPINRWIDPVTKQTESAGGSDGLAPTVGNPPVVANPVAPIILRDVQEGRATMQDFLAQLTNTQLATLSGGFGTNWGAGLCAQFGNLPAYGIPTASTADGAGGLRLADTAALRTTAWPTPTCQACTWNVDLVKDIWIRTGEEAKYHNFDVILGPGLNIHRNPLNGRCFEYYSEDPLVTGKMAAAAVNGLQGEGVCATIKHFACDNQQTRDGVGDMKNIMVTVSERALREIYLKGFEIAVKEANPWCIMTAYNSINGYAASENRELLTGIVRGEWKYDGLVMTDWDNGKTHTNEIAAGCDLKMPTGASASTITNAINSGAINRQMLLDNVGYMMNTLMKTVAFKNYQDPVLNHVVTAAGTSRIYFSDFIYVTGNGSVTPVVEQGGDLADHRASMGYCDNGTSMAYSINVEKSGYYNVLTRAAGFVNPNSGQYNFVVDDNVVGSATVAYGGSTSGYTNWRDQAVVEIPLTAGTHELRINVTRNGSNYYWMDFSFSREFDPIPVPHLITALGKSTILAVDYLNVKGNGTYTPGKEANPDGAIAQTLNNMEAGCSATYDILVEKTGIYDLALRVTGPDNPPGQFNILIDGVAAATVTATRTADWYTWVTLAPVQILLKEGRHELEIAATHRGSNISTLEFQPNSAVVTHQITAAGVTRILAADYTAAQGNGSVTPRIEANPDGAVANTIGYLDAGSSLTYFINVEKSGAYDVVFRATGHGTTTGMFNILIDGVVAATVTADRTANWDVWATLAPVRMQLSAGYHEMIIAVTRSGSNLSWMEFTYIPPETSGNLVPTEPAYNIPNYVCTWSYQDWWAYSADNPNRPVPQQHPRRVLNDATLFGSQGPGGPDGWCNTMYPDIRGDMYFLLDDGWDLDTSNNGFGNFDLDPTKFPGYGSTPEQRLTTLVNKVKACGWKGLGIWIYSSGNESYWRTGLTLCKSAGVSYWKVDWPDFSIPTKQLINRLRDEIYPELVVEHSGGGGPFNEVGGPYRTAPGEIDWRVSIGKISDVFRTYDVTGPLSIATSLDRIAQHLFVARTDRKEMGLLNGEDEQYMDAALGLTMGVMRYPIGSAPLGSLPNIFFGGARFPNSRPIRNMLDEVTRAAKWQRIAPAFLTDGYDTKLSDEYLADTWTYATGPSGPPDLRDTWENSVPGKSVIQRAPAVTARGVELPAVTVTSGDKPFVAASRNPTGAISVATFGRTDNTVGYHTNDTVKVSLNAGDLTGPIGVFGIFGELDLTFNQSLAGKTVLAQDIMDVESTNITGLVTIAGNTITIPGSVINTLGVSAGTPGDYSEPGLVIQIGDPKDFLPAPPINTPNPWDVYNPSFEKENLDAVNGATYGESTTNSRVFGWLPVTGTVTNAFIRKGGHTGQYEAVHTGTANFEASTYQYLNNLPNGTYNASVWVKSTTFSRAGSPTACGFFVKEYGGADKFVDIAAMAAAGQVSTAGWTKLQIDDIQVTNNQMRLEIHTLGANGEYVAFDDFQVTPVDLTSLRLVIDEMGGNANAVMENNTPLDRDVRLTAAVYDSGRLIKAASDAGEAKANGGILSFMTDINPDDYPGCEIKLFAWDAVTFAPICKAVDKITYGPGAFAIDDVTKMLPSSVSSSAAIYMGTGADSGPESYTGGQKYFSGYMFFPQINTEQPFTFDVDIYPTTTKTNQFIMGVGNERWAVKIYDPSATIQVWCHKSNGWPTLNISNATAVANGWALNKWQRITVAVQNGSNGTSFYAYLNGNLVGSVTNASTQALVASSALFGVGYDNDGNQTFDGYIGNARVCNVMLTTAQVAADGGRVPVIPVAGQPEMFRLKLGMSN